MPKCAHDLPARMLSMTTSWHKLSRCCLFWPVLTAGTPHAVSARCASAPRGAHPGQGGEGGVFGGQQEVAHERRIEHVAANAGLQGGEQAALAEALGRHVAARAVLVQGP